jgi:hypothetical protein
MLGVCQSIGKFNFSEVCNYDDQKNMENNMEKSSFMLSKEVKI